MADYGRAPVDLLSADDSLTPEYAGVVADAGVGAGDSVSVSHTTPGGGDATRTVTDTVDAVDNLVAAATNPGSDTDYVRGVVDALGVGDVARPVLLDGPVGPVSVLVRRPDRSVAGSILFDEFTMVERFNDVGRWTLTTTDAAMVSELTAAGAGVVVRRGGVNLMSGPPDYVLQQYQGGVASWTVAGPDDTHVLADTLAWPSPGAPVTAQTDAYDKRSGAAETVLKSFVVDNVVSRLGVDVVVPASQGLGVSKKWRARFTNLLELAQKIARSSDGLGFRVVQNDDRDLVLVVFEARDLTSQGGLFSDRTGTTLEWSYTDQWPTATRVVVGGGDEKADRMFDLYANTGRETARARIIENFKDRRDIDPADETAADEMDEEGATYLAESSGAQSFRLSVTDTPGLRYGTHFRVGDLVRAYPAGVQIDDRITEAELTVTSDGGEQVSMWVGQKDDDPDERRERRAREFNRRLQQIERAY